jgi:hypothetical protein
VGLISLEVTLKKRGHHLRALILVTVKLDKNQNSWTQTIIDGTPNWNAISVRGKLDWIWILIKTANKIIIRIIDTGKPSTVTFSLSSQAVDTTV